MRRGNVFKRNAGILMAISSLPSPYGIGTLGKEAYEFIDFVRDTNHKMALFRSMYLRRRLLVTGILLTMMGILVMTDM